MSIDACCHIDSFKQQFDDGRARGALNVIHGAGTLLKYNDLTLGSDYQDDIAFLYGTNRLYFHHHIVRDFNEGQTLLKPLLKMPWDE